MKEKMKMFTSLSAQYFIAPDYTQLTGDCALRPGTADLGKGGPDSCWGGSLTAQAPLSFSKNKTDYTCAPQPAGGNAFVRDFLGCVDGAVTFAEACVPAGLSLGSGYPMSQEVSDQHWEHTADASACNCGTPLGVNSTYTGTGCVVGVATFMLDPNSADKSAFFAKVQGSCSMMPKMNMDKATVGAVVGAAAGAAVGAGPARKDASASDDGESHIRGAHGGSVGLR